MVCEILEYPQILEQGSVSEENIRRYTEHQSKQY